MADGTMKSRSGKTQPSKNPLDDTKIVDWEELSDQRWNVWLQKQKQEIKAERQKKQTR